MPILLYHKVCDEKKSVWYVTPETFTKQMLSLKNKKIVYLDQYNPDDPNQFVITFDGVYRNILQYAAPILKKFHYPFELFVTGDYVGKDNSFDYTEPLEYFANEEELSKLIKMGGRLQWHTNTHRKFDNNLSLSDIEYEMQIPECIHKLDSKGFKWFAYPHGELTKDKIEIVKKYFKGALSCYQGKNSSIYELDRIMVFEETTLVPKKIHKKNIEKFLSVKNSIDKTHKILTIMGIEIKFKRKF